MLFAVLIGVFFLRSAVIYTDRKRPFLTPVRKKVAAIERDSTS